MMRMMLPFAMVVVACNAASSSALGTAKEFFRRELEKKTEGMEWQDEFVTKVSQQMIEVFQKPEKMKRYGNSPKVFWERSQKWVQAKINKKGGLFRIPPVQERVDSLMQDVSVGKNPDELYTSTIEKIGGRYPFQITQDKPNGKKTFKIRCLTVEPGKRKQYTSKSGKFDTSKFGTIKFHVERNYNDKIKMLSIYMDKEGGLEFARHLLEAGLQLCHIDEELMKDVLENHYLQILPEVLTVGGRVELLSNQGTLPKDTIVTVVKVDEDTVDVEGNMLKVNGKAKVKRDAVFRKGTVRKGTVVTVVKIAGDVITVQDANGARHNVVRSSLKALYTGVPKAKLKGRNITWGKITSVHRNMSIWNEWTGNLGSKQRNMLDITINYDTLEWNPQRRHYREVRNPRYKHGMLELLSAKRFNRRIGEFRIKLNLIDVRNASEL